MGAMAHLPPPQGLLNWCPDPKLPHGGREDASSEHLSPTDSLLSVLWSLSFLLFPLTPRHVSLFLVDPSVVVTPHLCQPFWPLVSFSFHEWKWQRWGQCFSRSSYTLCHDTKGLKAWLILSFLVWYFKWLLNTWHLNSLCSPVGLDTVHSVALGVGTSKINNYILHR